MRLIDADKLHYKRVWIEDHRGYRHPEVVVFAEEIDKLSKKYENVKIDECYICDLQGTAKCVQHGASGIIHPCSYNQENFSDSKRESESCDELL